MSRAFLLVHGKGGGPNSDYVALPEVADYINDNLPGSTVMYEEYSWGVNRRYDSTVEQSLNELHQHITELKKTHEYVYLIGQSIGGNFLIQYSKIYDTSHTGIILLNPAGNHGSKVYRKTLPWSIQKAQQMILDGNGDQVASFIDVMNSEVQVIECTPRHYVSFMDYDTTKLNMFKLSSNDFNGMKILWLCSERDPSQTSMKKLWPTILKGSDNASCVSVDSEYHGATPEHMEAIKDWVNTHEGSNHG